MNENRRVSRIVTCKCDDDGAGDCPSGGADESDVADIISEHDEVVIWDEEANYESPGHA